MYQQFKNIFCKAKHYYENIKTKQRVSSMTRRIPTCGRLHCRFVMGCRGPLLLTQPTQKAIPPLHTAIQRQRLPQLAMEHHRHTKQPDHLGEECVVLVGYYYWQRINRTGLGDLGCHK